MIGSCLYYSGHLLSSHLQDEDLKEINAYLKLNGILKLSSEKDLGKLVMWKEVFINESRKQNKNDGNEYRLIQILIYIKLDIFGSYKVWI